MADVLSRSIWMILSHSEEATNLRSVVIGVKEGGRTSTRLENIVRNHFYLNIEKRAKHFEFYYI